MRLTTNYCTNYLLLIPFQLDLIAQDFLFMAVTFRAYCVTATIGLMNISQSGLIVNI